MRLTSLSLLFLVATASVPVFAVEEVKLEDVQKLSEAIAADIASDEARLKSYCEMVKLYAEAVDASQGNDDAKAQELAKKAGEMGESLGEEYNKIVDSLHAIDPETDEGKIVVAAFEPIEGKCQR